MKKNDRNDVFVRVSEQPKVFKRKVLYDFDKNECKNYTIGIVIICMVIGEILNLFTFLSGYWIPWTIIYFSVVWLLVFVIIYFTDRRVVYVEVK